VLTSLSLKEVAVDDKTEIVVSKKPETMPFNTELVSRQIQDIEKDRERRGSFVWIDVPSDTVKEYQGLFPATNNC
jgi:hypothetical protein